MEELIAHIANIGFPIAISCFLLVKLDKKMEALTVSIQNLTSMLEILKDQLKQ